MSAAASDYIRKHNFVATCAGFCLVAGLLAPVTPATAQETMGRPAPRMDRMDRGGGSSAVGIGVGIGIGIIGGALQEGGAQPNKGAGSSEQSRTRGRKAKASDNGRTNKSHGSTKKVAKQTDDPPKGKGGKKDDKTVKKDEDGKKDKKTVKKDDDGKRDTTGKNENDEIVEVDCVLIVQYKKDEIFTEAQAHNEDLANSGSAGAPANATILTTSGDLPGAIGAFTTKGKKCCKSFALVSHGQSNGSIMLPYAIEGSDTPTELGGPATDAKTGKAANQEHFGKFVKALKGALCKTGKPTVTFNTCYGGVEGGIAEQVAGKGVATKGWDGYCEMGPVVDEKTQKKTWSAPGPDPTGKHTPANLQSFTPKEAEKKK